MNRRNFTLGTGAALLSMSGIRGAGAASTAVAPFNAEALAALRAKVSGSIAQGQMPGAVLLLAKGDAVHVETLGNTDFQNGTPLQRDTIFRIASFTKPVIATMVMMLVEDGRLRLDEPAERLLPELANRRVLKRLDGPIDETVPAERPILVRDLMNFTFGFGLQFDPKLPIQRAVDDLKLANGPPVPQTPLQPDEWMKAFGTLPLMHQPGATWMYNTSALILGVLIARAAGKPLGDVLEARIFAPLGMKDTAFFVPKDKLDRFQPAYTMDFGTGKAVLEDPVAGQWSVAPPFPSGGGGLVSTADDYLAFARLLMNKGMHEGKRLLSAASVAEMTRDQLTPAQKAGAGLGPGFFDKRGWGYGMAVSTAPDDITPNPGRYGWDGGYGTTWANDPNNGLIGIMLTQSSAYYVASNGFHDFWAGAYAALA